MSQRTPNPHGFCYLGNSVVCGTVGLIQRPGALSSLFMGDFLSQKHVIVSLWL